jgi:uncharacterized protein YjdB
MRWFAVVCHRASLPFLAPARLGCFLPALLLLGCSEPSTIDIEPERLLISAKSETLQLRATVKDRGGKVLSQTPVTFLSMTPTMATVDGSGSVQAITSGTATILIRAGKVSKEVDVLIQLAKRIAIDPDRPLFMLGVTKGFKATVYNDRDQPMIAGEIRWATSDPKIFTVDKEGNVKTVGEGEASLTVHAAGIQGSTTITVKHEELHKDGSLSQ